MSNQKATLAFTPIFCIMFMIIRKLRTLSTIAFCVFTIYAMINMIIFFETEESAKRGTAKGLLCLMFVIEEDFCLLKVSFLLFLKGKEKLIAELFPSMFEVLKIL